MFWNFSLLVVYLFASFNVMCHLKITCSYRTATPLTFMKVFFPSYFLALYGVVRLLINVKVYDAARMSSEHNNHYFVKLYQLGAN